MSGSSFICLTILACWALSATAAEGRTGGVPVPNRAVQQEGEPAKIGDDARHARRIKGLIAMLQSPDPNDREAGADYLAKEGPRATEALPHLAPLLKDEIDSVCTAAVLAMCAIGPRADDVTEIIRTGRVRLSKKGECWAAPYGCTFRPEAIPVLVKELGVDPRTDEIPENILAGLGAVARPAVERVLAEGGYRAESAAGVLWRMGPVAEPALPTLLSALRSGRITEFTFAFTVERFQTLSDEALAQLELISSESKDWSARSAANAILNRSK